MLLTFGLGMFLGAQISGFVVNSITAGDPLSVENWQVFWGIFSGAMLVFSAFFFLMFNDKVDTEDAAPAA